MAKEKLILDYGEETYSLIGIISDVKEYKLAWQLNNAFQVNFSLQNEVKLSLKGDRSFSFLYYLSEHSCYNLKLIKNKVVEAKGMKQQFVLPEVKNYDYLLMVDGENYEVFLDQDPFDHIRNASFVQYSNSINIENLKSQDNLIF